MKGETDMCLKNYNGVDKQDLEDTLTVKAGRIFSRSLNTLMVAKYQKDIKFRYSLLERSLCW